MGVIVQASITLTPAPSLPPLDLYRKVMSLTFGQPWFLIQQPRPTSDHDDNNDGNNNNNADDENWQDENDNNNDNNSENEDNNNDDPDAHPTASAHARAASSASFIFCNSWIVNCGL